MEQTLAKGYEEQRSATEEWREANKEDVEHRVVNTSKLMPLCRSTIRWNAGELHLAEIVQEHIGKVADTNHDREAPA